jgi:2-keto-4-pentenoate hydratase
LSAPAATVPLYPQALSVARRFVEARRTASPLEAFPGQPPADLAQGYLCQEEAIRLWPDAIAGWKIGRVPPERVADAGDDRLVGPIFAEKVQRLGWGAGGDFPAIGGGFAAVEAEYIFRLGADAPVGQAFFTRDEAVELVAAMHVGIELAGSPLATINALGPAVVVSDFGNNAGLLLGPEVADWATFTDDELVCETFVNGASVGVGTAVGLLGGPVGCLVFLLEHCARRGRSPGAGALISTGQVTGIHDVAAGDEARVVFRGLGELVCRVTEARPAP